MSFPDNFSIENNVKLRTPQIKGWLKLKKHFLNPENKTASLVLPVGCGKSGLIALTPFAISSKRVLVIAPGTKIRDQLVSDMKTSSPTNFYSKCSVIDSDTQLPEAVEVSSGNVNDDDIDHADIVIANIQQIAGTENKWLDRLDKNFFDAILVDEGHHNIAVSWQQVFGRFPDAKIINYSATPLRSDGQAMEGKIIYSFPVVEAIERGYVKRLNAKMLNPKTLTYVDKTSGTPQTIGSEEVLARGETDAQFRRGIVMSDESLGSIVRCSIAELYKLREETGERRLKIIASAIGINHCIQVVEAFKTMGLRADYVHANKGPKNDAVLERLENHELDVIVQARMLGEGFDHKYLSVAMVGNIYSTLSPFVQFVGRVMRVIEQNAPESALNRGVVVFHAGANVAKRWKDFRSFSEADQKFFDTFLPVAESVDFDEKGESSRGSSWFSGLNDPVEVREERGVSIAEMDPIGDPVVAKAIETLREKGITAEQAAELLRKPQPARQDVRKAKRSALSDRITTATGELLGRNSINPGGRELDPRKKDSNFQWVIAELNRRVSAATLEEKKPRADYTIDELDRATTNLNIVLESMNSEISNG